MTELDHTSFDTLVADLLLLVGSGAMGYKPRLFRFVYYDNHPPSTPWFPLKVERVLCDGIFIKLAYGSMDGGSWTTTVQAAHTFVLRDGYLHDEDDGSLCDFRRIALVDDPQSAPMSADDQLNENLRGVFG